MEPCFFYRATDKIYGIYSDSYLIVEIIDENDNVPIFSQNTYYAAINQDDPIGEYSTRDKSRGYTTFIHAQLN